MLLGERSDTDVLLIDAGSGTVVTAGDVRVRSEEFRSVSGRGLAFLKCDNSLGSVRDFVAVLEARIPVALMDPGLDPDLLTGLADRYRPDVLLQVPRPDVQGVTESAPGVWVAPEPGPASHPDVAVLLTTSGSTGSPKLVRLSRQNLLSNARQIVASLGIHPADRGVTALPLFYSFGMSIVTSHLLAGSSVVVTDRGVLDRQFWEDLAAFQVSFLPGVPQTFAMLKRLGFLDQGVPSLRAVIQAGGRLAPDLVAHFSELMRARGGEFFVMYGQTEAAPRIACLPPDRLPDKLGSAGVALEGGRLVAMNEEVELPAGEVGEVVYSGPNVMMGYAESRGDLALGDVQGPTLHTGDLGYLDDEGFLFLTGRSKRIAKLAGSRVSLDEIEAMVPDLGHVAAVDAGDAGICLFTTVPDPEVVTGARRQLARRLHVAVKLVAIEYVEELPLLGNGKVDYRTLTQMAKGDPE